MLVTGAVEDDRVVVEVMDDGAGVPAEMVPRLFTRFVHDGEEALTVGSVGLGLAVVKELATAMGGDAAYRRTGSWTIFEFWLPLAPESASSSAPTSWGAPTAMTNGTSGADVVLAMPRNVG